MGERGGKEIEEPPDHNYRLLCLPMRKRICCPAVVVVVVVVVAVAVAVAVAVVVVVVVDLVVVVGSLTVGLVFFERWRGWRR